MRSYISRSSPNKRHGAEHDAQSQFVFRDTLLSTLYANHGTHPHAHPARPCLINWFQSSCWDLQERFSNANGFTFVFVGKVRFAALKSLCRNVFKGSLPSTNQTSTFRDIGLRPVKGVIKKMSIAQEPKRFHRDAVYGRNWIFKAEQLKLNMLVELMNIKLIEKLREDLGGMYSGGMGGSLVNIRMPTIPSEALCLVVKCG